METMRAASPLRIGDVTLVAVERAVVRSATGEAGCWVGILKEIVAVVIRDTGGVRALAADSSEIPLDDLIRDTPNLAAILADLHFR